jgi:hypothetical protein
MNTGRKLLSCTAAFPYEEKADKKKAMNPKIDFLVQQIMCKRGIISQEKMEREAMEVWSIGMNAFNMPMLQFDKPASHQSPSLEHQHFPRQ